MCAACEFLVSGTLCLFAKLFVVRALGSFEKGCSKISLLLLLDLEEVARFLTTRE